MSKVFVVIEIGYEYDDQYYSVAGSNYGNTYGDPLQVFTSLEKAEANVKARTVKYLREHFVGDTYNNIGNWLPEGEGWESLFNDCEAAERLWKHEFDIELDEDDPFNVPIPASVTDDQLDRIYNLLSLQFYKLTEVDIDE